MTAASAVPWRFRRHPLRPLRGLLAAAALLAAAGCGEPPVDVAIPPREAGQSVLDVADVLSEHVAAELSQLRAEEELDIVALAYETSEASAGEARRAAQALVARWDADIALVAVAEEDAFTRGGQDGERFFGLEPADQFAVPRSLRERLVEQEVVPLAAEDDWDAVFLYTAETLAAELP